MLTSKPNNLEEEFFFFVSTGVLHLRIYFIRAYK